MAGWIHEAKMRATVAAWLHEWSVTVSQLQAIQRQWVNNLITAHELSVTSSEVSVHLFTDPASAAGLPSNQIVAMNHVMPVRWTGGRCQRGLVVIAFIRQFSWRLFDLTDGPWKKSRIYQPVDLACHGLTRRREKPAGVSERSLGFVHRACQVWKKAAELFMSIKQLLIRIEWWQQSG